MFRRFALIFGVATAILATPGLSVAQTPPAAESKPGATPPAPAASPPAAAAPAAAPAAAAPAGTHDPFGEDATLTAKPIVYLKGTGTWDNAFETITNAFKTLKAFIGKEGLKADGEPMTIFTSTDDAGFQFEAAIPVAEPPKNPPHGEIAVGTSPEGHALKFVHRGSYDGLDNTYEAITNYLDERVGGFLQSPCRTVTASQSLTARICSFDQQKESIGQLRRAARVHGGGKARQSPTHFRFVGIDYLVSRMRPFWKFGGVVDERTATISLPRGAVCQVSDQRAQLRTRIAFMLEQNFI
jgi:effector-binding domain-containing protein